MEIKTVSVIGLGALGVLFGHHLSRRMPAGDLRVIADLERVDRYRREQVYCNGELCEFHYITPEEDCDPADLLIFSVKFHGLSAAVKAVEKHVGPNTIILSLLNGLGSEEMIGQAYGMDSILYSVAQGMDAVKVGNRLTYQNMGMICFGDRVPGPALSEKAEAVADFFEAVGLPYQVDGNMEKRLWGKFMLNVGVNQAVAVYECEYGGIQREGPARDTMISAMKEVMRLSERERVCLTQGDLDYWLRVLDGLNPQGKPSMRQDLEAGRHSEVELFAGAVLSLGKKHGLPCPTNQLLYDRIQEMERHF